MTIKKPLPQEWFCKFTDLKYNAFIRFSKYHWFKHVLGPTIAEVFTSAKHSSPGIYPAFQREREAYSRELHQPFLFT